MIVVLAAIAYIGKSQIIDRSFSNTGHIQLFIQGRKMFVDSPIIGEGAAYV